MKALIKTALFIAVAAGLSACGGGGSVSTGGTYFTHEQLAHEFVRRLNVDVYGYDVVLVKADTLQYDYVVVRNRYTNDYDAYYIGNYNPGEDLGAYMYNYSYMAYYNLYPEGGNTYRDYISGKLFETDDSATLDTDQVMAAKQMAAIDSGARSYREQYGMSEEASLNTARFALQMKSTPAGSIDKTAMDRFSKKLTGSTISEFQAASKAGNVSDLVSRVNLAQEKTGMSDEGLQKLMGEMFK